MKRCLVVGCDRLGAKQNIICRQYGVDEIIHWDGRKSKLPNVLPKNTKIVLVYSGFISHKVMFAVRDMAKKARVQLVFLKRGLAEVS
jgi:hypothetical protein